LIFILCHNIVEDKPAILILDKKPFPENEDELNECIKGLSLVRISDNDIYLSADANLPFKFNGLLNNQNFISFNNFSQQVDFHLSCHREAHYQVPLQAVAFVLRDSGGLQKHHVAVH
jgi:hypothetical protein